MTKSTGERRPKIEEGKAVLCVFPKLHCPFIRQTFQVNKKHWKEHGAKLKLRKAEVYLVVDRINPGYEWVFDDPDTIAVEKLDGTNVKILTEGVVFYNLKRKAEKKTYMAKLRRDMFDWFYTLKIDIHEYDNAGRDELEDQEQFD
ncbi:MAG: hypothetical protein GY854_03825 [Deltaproteobacteria bacterium]|nr:hypothetical protein [Deltaproteobacteria bacterium]